MNTKNTTSKLTLTRESLRELTTADLHQLGAAGAAPTDVSVCVCHTDICGPHTGNCTQ
jgi:hypothetical protein